MNESLENRLQAAVYESLRMIEQNELIEADAADLELAVMMAEKLSEALTRLCDRL
jgi:hypothetical protein